MATYQFPNGFVWGVATAAAQIEGAAHRRQGRIDLGPVRRASRARSRTATRPRSPATTTTATRPTSPCCSELGIVALPALGRLAARLPARRRTAQRTRARLLLPADRRPARAQDHPLGHALSLGPAPGARGPGRLARARHGRRLRPLRRGRRQAAGRPRDALVHGQRDPLLHRQRLRQRLLRPGPARGGTAS